jgi:hypothetical protein
MSLWKPIQSEMPAPAEPPVAPNAFGLRLYSPACNRRNWTARAPSCIGAGYGACVE